MSYFVIIITDCAGCGALPEPNSQCYVGKFKYEMNFFKILISKALCRLWNDKFLLFSNFLIPNASLKFN